jgi:Ser/Thr protein kinase RdoA (MazF antagonist)
MPNLAVIRKIAVAYGLQPQSIAAPERGYRNHSFRLDLPGGRRLNLIQYKRDPDILDRIRRANAVGEYLAGHDLPVRAPADPRILRITGRTTTTYASLYNYLPGATIPWEAYTRRHIKLLGLTMGRLHAELATMPNSDLIQTHPATTELLHQIRQILTYFAYPNVHSALRTKLGLRLNETWLSAQSTLIEYVAGLPSQQPLHLDLVRSNVLFTAASPRSDLERNGGIQLDNLAVTGIIDFEKTAWGSPLLDLARTLAFLLVDCRYKTPNQIRKYFLYSGYVKRGGGDIGHHRRPGHNRLLLDELVDYYLFYDFAKFLRHNPYESLSQNAHFLRTRSLLMQRNLLV